MAEQLDLEKQIRKYEEQMAEFNRQRRQKLYDNWSGHE